MKRFVTPLILISAALLVFVVVVQIGRSSVAGSLASNQSLSALKYFGLFAAASIGTFSLMVDFKKDGHITRAGRLAVAMNIIAFLVATGSELVQQRLREEAAKTESERLAADVGRSEQALSQIRRALYPFTSVTMKFSMELALSDMSDTQDLTWLNQQRSRFANKSCWTNIGEIQLVCSKNLPSGLVIYYDARPGPSGPVAEVVGNLNFTFSIVSATKTDNVSVSLCSANPINPDTPSIYDEIKRRSNMQLALYNPFAGGVSELPMLVDNNGIIRNYHPLGTTPFTVEEAFFDSKRKAKMTDGDCDRRLLRSSLDFAGSNIIVNISSFKPPGLNKSKYEEILRSFRVYDFGIYINGLGWLEIENDSDRIVDRLEEEGGSLYRKISYLIPTTADKLIQAVVPLPEDRD